MSSRPPRPASRSSSQAASRPTSLREAALAGSLPDHQVMDQPTLTWILQHRPAVAEMTIAVADPPALLLPEPAWFAVPGSADGLHGVGHNARVGLLAGLLARHHNLDPDQSTALRMAAAVHDCRRRDDRADPGHGERTAVWLARHHEAVTAAFGLTLAPELVAVARTAVSLHDVPYAAFSADQREAYRRARGLTDLLKAADCLDRYRLPLAQWWPRTSLLRVEVPDWLHGVAFGLMWHSEQARLDGASHLQALTHARQSIAGADRG